jgi:hypothetical protein
MLMYNRSIGEKKVHVPFRSLDQERVNVWFVYFLTNKKKLGLQTYFPIVS